MAAAAFRGGSALDHVVAKTRLFSRAKEAASKGG